MAENDRTVSSRAGVVWMYVGSFSTDTPPPPHAVINTAGPTASNATRMAFIAEPPELRFCEVACYSGRTKCLRIHHHWPLSHRKLALGSLLLGGGSWRPSEPLERDATHTGLVADTIQVEPFRLTSPSVAASGPRARSTASTMTGRCSTPTSRTKRETAPTWTEASAAPRGVAPRDTAASKRCTSTAPKPAPDRMTRNLCSSANANGPGAFGSAGAGVTPIAARAAESGTIAHGLSRGARQQTNTLRPPA